MLRGKDGGDDEDGEQQQQGDCCFVDAGIDMVLQHGVFVHRVL